MTQSRQSCPPDREQRADKSRSDRGSRRGNGGGEWKGLCLRSCVMKQAMCAWERGRGKRGHSELSVGCQEPCWCVWALMHHPLTGAPAPLVLWRVQNPSRQGGFPAGQEASLCTKTNKKRYLPQTSLPHRVYRLSRAIPSRIAAEG